MNKDSEKAFMDSTIGKLSKYVYGISIETGRKTPPPPPNTPIEIIVPKNPPNTPINTSDFWPCRDEYCTKLIDNKSELFFNGRAERMCPKCGTTRFKPF